MIELSLIQVLYLLLLIFPLFNGELYVTSGVCISNRKKKRGQRAVGGDKTGRGLRQFSMKGCCFLLLFVSSCSLIDSILEN